MREAANCSQLRRNFLHSRHLLVPGVHWDWCTPKVMVMERMSEIPIAQVDRLREAGVDLKRLSRAGVELFFTQVFRDGFFHADMHPGNIFVSTDPAHSASTSRSTSASSARCPSATRPTSRRTSSPSSAATTGGSPPRTSSPAGCPRTRGSTARDRDRESASRSSTGRSPRSRSARCSCSCSGRRVASTSRSSRSSRCCRRRCSTSRGSDGSRPAARPVGDGEAVPRAVKWRTRSGSRRSSGACSPRRPTSRRHCRNCRGLHQRLFAPAASSDTAMLELAASQRARNRWMAVLSVSVRGTDLGVESGGRCEPGNRGRLV